MKSNGLGEVGRLAPLGAEEGALRFVLEEVPAPDSRLAAARALLREAKESEWEERQRLARARSEGVTAAQAALLQARQTQVHDAQAAVDDLLRRAGSLRQAIGLAEESLAAQRRLLARLRRELAEIGE